MDSTTLEMARQKRIDDAWERVCKLNAEIEKQKMRVSEPVKSEPLKIQEKNGIRFVIHHKEK